MGTLEIYFTARTNLSLIILRRHSDVSKKKGEVMLKL